jgi:hypothetical protein
MFTLCKRLLTTSCVSNCYYRLHIFSGSVFAGVRLAYGVTTPATVFAPAVVASAEQPRESSGD